MDYFPYLPQNPWTDKPEQDLSSMSLEIAAGAGMEAIIFGTFGVKIEEDKLTYSNPIIMKILERQLLRILNTRTKHTPFN